MVLRPQGGVLGERPVGEYDPLGACPTVARRAETVFQ